MNDHVTDWWSTVSLRTKVTGVTVLLIILGLLVAGVGTMSVLRNYLQGDVDSKVLSYSKTITNISGDVTSSTCGPSDNLSGFFFGIVDTNGNTICTNLKSSVTPPDLKNLDLISAMSLADGPTVFTLWDTAHGGQWRAVDQVLQTSDGGFVTLVVGMNLDEMNNVIGRFIGIFLGFGLSIVILGAALTRLLVTSTFAPLREVEATAAAIAEGDFSQRLPGATPNTEVGRLNRSLNTMLNRIDRAFADRAKTIDQMRRFVGDASHELRTPLVSVRGYAELYRMGAIEKPEDVAQAMERIEKEAIRMGELVEDLLELARIDEAKPLQLAAVDLVPIAHDVALDAMASAPDRTVSVIVVPQEPAEDAAPAPTTLPRQNGRPLTPVTGPIAFAGAQLARLRRRPARNGVAIAKTAEELASSPVPAIPAIVLAEENKIRQVITNLMGNAMRFTPDGSPIELVVRVDPRRAVAMLDVVDHGEGVPPQIREKIFQRFWRADTSRTRETGGSGLGLAIVSGLIASHKGEVDVLDTPGGGATFRVVLPLLPAGYQPPAAPQRR